LSTPQAELLVTILAGFATFERHLIKAGTYAVDPTTIGRLLYNGA
jgi:hypothetical protein